MTVSDSDDAKNPIDQALDVLVYLPLGLVLDFPRSVPRYIERGRQHFDVARRLSREVMPGAFGDPVRQLDRLQAQTRSTLRALGVTGVSAGQNGRNGDGLHLAELPLTASTVRVDPDAPATRTTRVRSTEPAIDPDTLAIHDYDSLSASQVVPRLDGLEPDELEAVRQYESAKRGRKTILSKVAQLQAG